MLGCWGAQVCFEDDDMAVVFKPSGMDTNGKALIARVDLNVQAASMPRRAFLSVWVRVIMGIPSLSPREPTWLEYVFHC